MKYFPCLACLAAHCPGLDNVLAICRMYCKNRPVFSQTGSIHI